MIHLLACNLFLFALNFVLAFFFAVLSVVFRSDTDKMDFTSLNTAAIYFSSLNKNFFKTFYIVDRHFNKRGNKQGASEEIFQKSSPQIAI